jgi:hypothetical protein
MDIEKREVIRNSSIQRGNENIKRMRKKFNRSEIKLSLISLMSNNFSEVVGNSGVCCLSPSNLKSHVD